MLRIGDPHVQAFATLSMLGLLLQLFLWKIASLPTTSSLAKAFRPFQRNYLTVFLIMCASDWLQGPYIYALYQDYGMTKTEIGVLFVIGFGTSGIFGAVAGSLADSWGRRRMCLLFAVLYSFGCITKHVPNFYVLGIGRVFCGAATSILFSVFDAWMVCEHHHRRFDSEWLGHTFSAAAFWNGFTAIVSAIVASFVAESYGKVAPFDAAILLLVIGGMIILFTWNENYGSNASDESALQLFGEALRKCRNDPKIVYCGLGQSFFEGAMYTFVLMWTPSLPNNINHGVIFGCFMVAVMIGSEVFQLATQLYHWTLETFTIAAFAISFLTMMVPVATTDPKAIFTSFIVFEFAVGLYLSAFYTLRSEIVPDKGRATILNLYRIPLNLIVVVVCVFAGQLGNSTVFSFCALFEVCGLACMLAIKAMRCVQKSTVPIVEDEYEQQPNVEMSVQKL